MTTTDGATSSWARLPDNQAIRDTPRQRMTADGMWLDMRPKVMSNQDHTLSGRFRVKFPSFEYHRPGSLPEALALLAEIGDDALPLAGGQSLFPMMAYRLAAPSALVDLAAIAGMNRIEQDDNSLRLGAMLRWCDVLQSPLLADVQPLLVEAIRHVAHPQIRNRGTLGGSLAHADAAAEFPAICVLSDAQVEIASVEGRRVVPAGDFVLGAMTTDLNQGELIEAIRFPAWRQDRRWSFREFARRKGDFALAGTAMFCDPVPGTNGFTGWHVVCFGLGDGAQRLSAIEEMLDGVPLTDALVDQAAQRAESALQADPDIHAPPEDRRALAAELLRRGLCDIRDGGMKRT